MVRSEIFGFLTKDTLDETHTIPYKRQQTRFPVGRIDFNSIHEAKEENDISEYDNSLSERS